MSLDRLRDKSQPKSRLFRSLSEIKAVLCYLKYVNHIAWPATGIRGQTGSKMKMAPIILIAVVK